MATRSAQTNNRRDKEALRFVDWFFRSAAGTAISAATYGGFFGMLLVSMPAMLLPNPTADQTFLWAFVGLCAGVVIGLFFWACSRS